jgi:hypothetical protein
MASLRGLGRRALILALTLAAIEGCNSITGAGDLEIADGQDGRDERDATSEVTAPSSDGGATADGDGIDDGSSPISPGSGDGRAPDWAYRRPIALSSDASGTLVNHAVLVALPSTFAYDHANVDGSDLRFSHTVDHSDDLPYFIETWQPGGVSWIWVLLPSVPTGPSSLQLFYGRPSATTISSFAAVFPNARRTTGGGAGSFTATGDIAVDWFELKAGDSLFLAGSTPLKITAQRVIIAGSVVGDGRGFPGGTTSSRTGFGPGGGQPPSGQAAGGGGGHGGTGGRGGSDDPGVGGTPGVTYGADTGTTIDMGSGGGATSVLGGGAGGGAIAINGWRTTINGVISVNGLVGGGLYGNNGGGGSGGGILVTSCFLDAAAAALSARGGNGGACAQSSDDGGGGGGGGRVKMHVRGANGGATMPASTTVAPGVGGSGAGCTSPGSPGIIGTANIIFPSNALTGVETTIGAEVPGF